MQRELFKSRFLSASARARDLARTYVLEALPDAMQFNVHLNCSYDGAANGAFRLFPEDSAADVAARTKHLSADQVIDLLWREGLVPQWVNLAVVGEKVEGTLLDVEACGRFIADEAALYYTWTDCAPFSAKGPALPARHAEGERFSIYERSSCWSREDFDRVVDHRSQVWSLELHGQELDDDALAMLAGSNLEILELHKMRFRGAGLAHLAGLASLRVLRIDVGDVAELSLERMSNVERLESLSVEDMPEKVVGLARLLLSTPNLKVLSLAGPRDLALDAIQLPPLLDELRLTFPHAPSWALLSPTVRSLSIHAHAGTDAEVTTILSAPSLQLESLGLRGTPVTDAILDVIARFPRLRYLDLVDTHVTRDAIQALAQSRPSLRYHPRATAHPSSS